MRPVILALFGLTALPALAEPATEAEAARLQAVFERYVGAETGIASVAPDGESYVVTLDPAPLVAMIPDDSATVTVAPYQLRIAPLGGGRWDVEPLTPFAFDVDVPDLFSMRVGYETFTSSAVWNDSLSMFESVDSVIGNLSMMQRTVEPSGAVSEISYDIEEITYRERSTAAAEGGVDSTSRISATGITETVAMEGMPFPMTFDITLDGYEMQAEVAALQPAAMLDLLAWAVARPQGPLTAAQESELKAALQALVPVFAAVSSDATFTNLVVDSPFGRMAAESGVIEVAMNGVVADGRLHERIALDGLTLPTQMIPPWAHPLLPDSAQLDFTVDGFDLAGPAGILLTEVNFLQGPDAETEARLLSALLPDGVVSISTEATGAVSAEYDLSMSGTLLAGPVGDPTGEATIRLIGMDAILAALGTAPDDVSSGAVPAMMMARGMAQAQEGGALVWNIELTADGGVLVNGIDMSAMGAQ